MSRRKAKQRNASPPTWRCQCLVCRMRKDFYRKRPPIAEQRAALSEREQRAECLP